MSERFPRDTAQRKLREENYRRATAAGQRLQKWESKKDLGWDVLWGAFLGGMGIALVVLSVTTGMSAWEYYSRERSPGLTLPTKSKQVTFPSIPTRNRYVVRIEAAPDGFWKHWSDNTVTWEAR